MKDYSILIYKFQQNDSTGDNEVAWAAFLAQFDTNGLMRGGSSLGESYFFHKADQRTQYRQFFGYLRIATSTFAEVQSVCREVPDYHLGATIEICTLVRD